MSKILAMLVRAIAEGDPKNPVTKIYWKVAGYKTWFSILLYALWAFGEYVLVPVFLMCGAACGTPEGIADLQEYVNWLPPLATVLLGFGLFDAGVRLEPPEKRE